MPIDIIDPNKRDEDDDGAKPTSAPGSAFSTTSNAPSASQRARASQAGGPTARGTGFTGVGRYLQANVGSGLGQRVAGRVAQTGQQAAARLGQSVRGFGEQLGATKQQFGNQLGAARGALQSIIAGTDGPNQTVDPTAAYHAVTTGEFKAPTGLQNIQGIQSQAALAGELAKGTETSKGRMGLLREMLGRGTRGYTSGQSALDSLILGQSGGQLAAARRGALGLGRQVEAQRSLAEEQARQTGAEFAGAGKELAGMATGAESSTLGDIATQKTAYETGLEEKYGKIQSDIKSGELSKDSLAALKNLGIDENSQFYGIPPDQIANLIARKAPSEITSASSATKEQISKTNALRKLMGQTAQFSEEDIKKAGTTIDPLTGLSTTQDMGELLKKQRASYEDVLGSLSNEGEEAAINRYFEQQKIREDNKAKYGSNYYDSESGYDPTAPSLGGTLFTGAHGGENVDLARRYAAGELFNKETGQLNTDFATQLRDYWNWRHQKTGNEGFTGTGAGTYRSFGGDAERVQKLNDLIAKSGKTFKVKPE